MDQFHGLISWTSEPEIFRKIKFMDLFHGLLAFLRRRRKKFMDLIHGLLEKNLKKFHGGGIKGIPGFNMTCFFLP